METLKLSVLRFRTWTFRRNSGIISLVLLLLLFFHPVIESQETTATSLTQFQLEYLCIVLALFTPRPLLLSPSGELDQEAPPTEMSNFCQAVFI